MTEITLRAPQDRVAAARAAHADWRQRRHQTVTAPTGHLALVETRWLPLGDETALDEVAAGQPDHVVVTALQRTDLASGAVQRGFRFWDAHAPAIAEFERIDSFPFAPEWVVEAQFTPVDEARTIPFEHIRDNGATRDLIVPGDIQVTIDGVAYALSAFADGDTLLLVFGDPTNNAPDPETRTYGPGRFLAVPTSRGVSTPGTVWLDFNQAFVPPCGFSAHYNCPLPPPQNRLHVPVLAGERDVVSRANAPHSL